MIVSVVVYVMVIEVGNNVELDGTLVVLLAIGADEGDRTAVLIGEVVVLLLIIGTAKAELARAATMKENEACILKDECKIALGN